MLRGIYDNLPSSLQRGIDELWSAIPPNIKLGTAYGDMRKLLSVSDSWTQDQIHAWQNTVIKKLLHHAYSTTVFYRRIFDDAGFNPESFQDVFDLQRIPSITKQTVQENMQDMLSNAFSYKHRIRMTTGGTTGRQLVFYAQKRFTMAREKAFFD